MRSRLADQQGGGHVVQTVGMLVVGFVALTAVLALAPSIGSLLADRMTATITAEPPVGDGGGVGGDDESEGDGSGEGFAADARDGEDRDGDGPGERRGTDIVSRALTDGIGDVVDGEARRAANLPTTGAGRQMPVPSLDRQTEQMLRRWLASAVVGDVAVPQSQPPRRGGSVGEEPRPIPSGERPDPPGPVLPEPWDEPRGDLYTFPVEPRD